MTVDTTRARSGRGVLLVALALASLLTTLAVPAEARAQTTPQRGWTRVRVAKWALLGVAIGFGVYAVRHSDRADANYDDLRTLCNEEPEGCVLENGKYVASGAEELYQSSVREDRRTQLAIIGGQVTLLGSVALFVYDLRNARGPENIPYPPSDLSRLPARRVAVGARVRF